MLLENRGTERIIISLHSNIVTRNSSMKMNGYASEQTHPANSNEYVCIKSDKCWGVDKGQGGLIELFKEK